MPKWVKHPKKARSSLQKSHISLLAAHRIELQQHTDGLDSSGDHLCISTAVESLSAAMKGKDEHIKELKRVNKNTVQRERRLKDKVINLLPGCQAHINMIICI